MLAQHQGLLCFTLCAPSWMHWGAQGAVRGQGWAELIGIEWPGHGSLWCNQRVCSVVHLKGCWFEPIQGQLHLSSLPQPGFFHPAWCHPPLWRPGCWPVRCRSDQFTVDHIHHWHVPHFLWCCHTCTKPPVVVNDCFCFCYTAYHFLLPFLVEWW